MVNGDGDGDGNGREEDPTLNPYYNPYALAGQEISSTGEGRHVTVEEWLLYHPYHDAGDDLVHKGDPVLMDGLSGVGIALKTATSLNEAVPIDTEGIWRVSVDSYYGIYVGEALVIDGFGIVSDDFGWSFCVFGYALQEIPAPNDGYVTAVIAVKVHWGGLPWWWFL